MPSFFLTFIIFGLGFFLNSPDKNERIPPMVPNTIFSMLAITMSTPMTTKGIPTKLNTMLTVKTAPKIIKTTATIKSTIPAASLLIIILGIRPEICLGYLKVPINI